MQERPATRPAARAESEDASWGEHGRRLRFLQRVPLFRGLSRELLAPVATALKPYPMVPGGIICHEGEPADSFYLVESGTLVVLAGSGDRSYELARLGPGAFLGELALLEGGHRSATVRAETAARLWALSGSDFREMLARMPDLDRAIRSAGQARQTATDQALFEVENRNLAVLTERRSQIRIGRGADNDLVFRTPLVSRHHAVLEKTGDAFRLRDLDSHNGTYVNGTRIRSAMLEDGAEIQVGDERFVFDHRELRQATEPRGLRVDLDGLTRTVKGGMRILNDISLSILPGELVAIVGGSGAGKSTLMNAISGVRPATGGHVLYNGRDYYQNQAVFRPSLGYVPQDDIIHKDLSVRRTLWFAGKLRLPPDTSDDELHRSDDEALGALDLAAQADLRVASLSGGQRKRASIGVELLTRPLIFFLDEPTSGLDPATDAQMIRLMRRLADAGSTVVLTTHATKNVSVCDKVVFLGRGGYLACAGTPQQALHYFQVEAFDEIYDRLSQEATPEAWAQQFRASDAYAYVIADQAVASAPPAAISGHPSDSRSPRPFELVRQWAVLSHRNFDILTKNPANLIPLFATPLVITVLLVLLYHAGDFKLSVANPMTPAQILFFLAFSGFFFGLSYGLQEICKEFPIFYRERLVNLGIAPYLLSKVVVLLPILTVVLMLMLVMLWLTERLPSSGMDVYIRLAVTLVLTAFSGLATGLAFSAIAKTSEQAAIMLPGLVLPQVLFCGVLQPVPFMSIVPRTLSTLMAMRWSFEGLGKIVDLNHLFANAVSLQGAPLLQQYGNSFSHAPARDWIILGAMILVFLALADLVLTIKSTER